MRVRRADINDYQEIFRVVNDAYSIEKGDTGLAFKCDDRYICLNQAMQDLQDKDIYFYGELGETDKKCCGCIAAKINNVQKLKKCNLGPFAVDPAYQSMGIGSKLLESIYEWCCDNKVDIVEIEVVNHRTDLFTFPDKGYYGKRGYRKTGTKSCSDMYNCGEEMCSRPSYFITLEKPMKGIFNI